MQKPEKTDAQLLAEEVARANRAYFDGRAVMSDEAYDKLKAELRAADPACPLLSTVGAPVNPGTALKKAKHRLPMGSLSNAFSVEDIAQFFRRTGKLLRAAGFDENLAVTLQPKMDGFSVDLVYEQGRLVQAITRGDGVEGEDITHNIVMAKGVPHVLPRCYDVAVRGEVVIHRDDFMAHFQGDSNPRSSAAGTARRIDRCNAQHLRFYAFDAEHFLSGRQPYVGNSLNREKAPSGWAGTSVVGVAGPLAKTEAKSLDILTEWGFQTVSRQLIRALTTEDLLAAVIDAWNDMRTKRSELPFDIDGIVCKISSIEKSRSCGVADSCPRGMVAMKWAGSMTAKSTVVGIDHSVGRTGAITPVATIRPTECGGVVISSVSLCNWDEVHRLGVGLGCDVIVERAGEVIPKITSVVRRPDPMVVFPRPQVCPKCDEPTQQDGPRQLCVNQECPGRAFRKVMHWAKQLDILHLGDETVDRLMAVDGPVQTIADLYRLKPAQLAAAAGGHVMGKKIGESIEKSRHLKLHEFLGSIGIAGFGQTDALKLVRGLGLRNFAGFMRASEADIVAVRGFAEEKAAKIIRSRDAHANLLRDLVEVLDIENPPADGEVLTGPLAGKTFCATGASEINRDTLRKILCDAGAEWKTSVVNGLDYLIMADPSSTSIKAEAARKKGVTCISEATALDMAGYKG